MKHILLTGFEPFGGDTTNPAWDIAQALDGERIGRATVVARQLPCVFGRRKGGALHVLAQAMREVPAQSVLCLGLAAGRSGLCLERVAINVDDARIADNAGAQPVDKTIVAQGPAAYFSTLPIKSMLAAVTRAGVAASVSQTAGTFVCNHVFYGLMHALAGQRAVRGGFLHVPATPELATPGMPCLPLAVQIAGVRAALLAAETTRRDIRLGAGAVA